MKVQCKFCRKRMEPKIVVEERRVNENQRTYYCSLCDKKLLTLGSQLEKPFWEQPWYSLWMPGFVIDAIGLWEFFKTTELNRTLKIIFIIVFICLSIAVFFYF